MAGGSDGAAAGLRARTEMRAATLGEAIPGGASMASKVHIASVSLLAALALSGCGYNRIQGSDEAVKAAWAEVANQYQRRADLVPNLVNTVKGAADFERSTLEAVVQARARATQVKMDPSVLNDPAAFRKVQETQGELSSALGRLLVVVEKYPDLKASAAFRDLQ